MQSMPYMVVFIMNSCFMMDWGRYFWDKGHPTSSRVYGCIIVVICAHTATQSISCAYHLQAVAASLNNSYTPDAYPPPLPLNLVLWFNCHISLFLFSFPLLLFYYYTLFTLMTWRRHLATADPFHVNDHETQDYDKTTTSNELLEQAPATRKELWGYYLYYNGVSNSNKDRRNDGDGGSYAAMI